MKTCILVVIGAVLFFLPGGDYLFNKAPKEPILETKTVAQIAFVVKDIEKASAAWAEVLGIDPPKPFVSASFPGRPTTFHGTVTNAEAKLAFIKMDNIELELIEPLGEGSTWKEFLDTYGEGIHHIGFWVKDLDGMRKKLELKGIPTIQTGGWNGGGYNYVDALETLGCYIELLERFNE